MSEEVVVDQTSLPTSPEAPSSPAGDEAVKASGRVPVEGAAAEIAFIENATSASVADLGSQEVTGEEATGGDTPAVQLNQVNAPQWMQAMFGEGEENFDAWKAIGGVRGSIEALLPGVLFVVTYLVSGQNLGLTLGISAVASILFCIARAVQRSNPLQAFSGLLGVGVGVLWAALSGRAENYYAFGLVGNLSYLAVLLVTLACRYSLAGILVKLFFNLPGNWRKLPEFRVLYRRCAIVTWVWVALFAIRLVVQAPLYYQGEVVALGTAKLVLGLPLFAIAVWLTWMLLRGLIKPAKEMAAKLEEECPPSAKSSN